MNPVFRFLDAHPKLNAVLLLLGVILAGVFDGPVA